MLQHLVYFSSTTTPGVNLPFHVKEQNEVEDLGREAADTAKSNKNPVDMYDLQHTLQVRIVLHIFLGWYLNDG